MCQKILSFIILFVSIQTIGQKANKLIPSTERILGETLSGKTPIKGKVYTFEDRIDRTYYDESSGMITLQLRGLSKNGKWMDNVGRVVQFDINNSTVLWDKKIVYTTTQLQQFPNMIIYSVANKSFIVDANSGEEGWTIKNNIYYVDKNSKIGIGYKFKTSTGYTDILEGIDLLNGSVLWQRKLDRSSGWNNLYRSSDSTVVVVSSGLHQINLYTGKGWDYEMKTGLKDYKGNIAANTIGVFAGLLTGTFMLSTGHDVVRDLVSNELIDGQFTYFASKDLLVKLNSENGTPIWQHTFPDKDCGNSNIFMYKNMICMINKGFGHLNDKKIKYGRPFVAAFDIETGKQIYSFNPDESNIPIESFYQKDDYVFLCYKNKIQKIALEKGAKVSEKMFNEVEVGELKYFVGNNVFTEDKLGSFISLGKSDTTAIYAYTNKGQILALDSDSNLMKVYDKDQYVVSYLQNDNLLLFSKGNISYIAEKDGNVIAEIETPGRMYINNSTLYFANDNTLSVIDLGQFMNKHD